MDTFRFERPARRDDAPPPATQAIRRVSLPDGQHWVDVRGGGSQIEAQYIAFVQQSLMTAMRRVTEAESANDAATTQAAIEARDAAEMAFNAAFATYIGDRVVAHNLTYPGEGGEPLPLGLDLYWALSGEDAMRLVVEIQRPPSVFADPKDGPRSPTG